MKRNSKASYGAKNKTSEGVRKGFRRLLAKWVYFVLNEKRIASHRTLASLFPDNMRVTIHLNSSL